MRNVVVICLDTVRKDYFDRYAPRLQNRADVVYNQCRAASSWSVPSHASMFTGRLPSNHGIHTANRNFSGLSRDQTFMSELNDYRTLGVSANVWASSAFGFDVMFDEFSDTSPDRRFPDGMHIGQFGQECEADGIGKRLAFIKAALAHENPLRSLANGALVQFDDLTATLPIPKPLDDGAKPLTRQAQSMIKKSDEPFFLFTNLMDAHGPLRHIYGFDRDIHDAPLGWTSETETWADVLDTGDEELIDRYRELYGAAIDYLDRVVCAFVDQIKAETSRETSFVITADHGDSLDHDGDDEQWGHVRSSLSEALLHVPQVVLNAPGSVGNVDEYVTHLSLGELVVGLAEAKLPDITRSRISAERVGYSGKYNKVDKKAPDADRALRCVYENDIKYCWGELDTEEVYRLDRNRPCWEERTEGEFDIPSLESELFSTPLDQFLRDVGDQAGTDDIDATTADRLRDLGYM